MHYIQRNFISKQQSALMADRLEHMFFLNKTEHDPVTNSEDICNLFLPELNEWLPKVESIFKTKLFPTYNWSKIYSEGGLLPAHKDRDFCEYSVTLCLENEKALWPIFLKTIQGVQKVVLEQGDALLYKGIEQLHWREVLTNGHVYQSFFHYVDQNGPHAALKYRNH
jgi:hypothetical protein